MRPPGSLLFILSSLDVGGSERKTVRLANFLARAGWSVTMLYLNGPHVLRPQIDPGITVQCLERRGKFSLTALMKLRRHLRASGCAAFIAVNLYAGLYAVLAAALVRGAAPVWVSVNSTEFGTSAERRQMLLYRWVLRAARGVIFGASSQMQLWEERFSLRRSRRNFVLYNGIDEQQFSPSAATATGGLRPATKFVLGTVGRLRKEKAHVDLMRAVAILRDRGFDVGALVVGEGPERVAIEAECKRLNLGKTVVIAGGMTDVRPGLAAMDIFVLTSVAVETFSNAVLEAMAMGKPIVSARIGGMPEMLDAGGGLLYAPGNVAELCERLEMLLVDAEQRDRLGVEARAVVKQRYSLPAMAHTLITNLFPA